jgi:Flp pilus assembly protein TadG
MTINLARTSKDMAARFGRNRRGQVLPLGLVFLVICCASLLFMFSAGKVVDEKLTVTNAADAAAYSAGIAHARALNYEAYVNRAIIANELAIAQAVSMVSWMRYFEAGVYNVGTWMIWSCGT